MSRQTADVEYSDRHLEFLDFWSYPGEITIKALCGQFGSGKTFACVDCYLELVATHGAELAGFSSKSPPVSGIVGATFGGLMDGPITELLKQVPEGWIARHVLYGSNPFIEWANGHRTMLYTAKVLNPRRGGRGPSLCFIWADEAQDDAYDERTWVNILSRPRDKRAVRPTVLISGVARRGTAIESLLRGKDSDKQRTVILSLQDNLHALHPGMRRQALESMPASALRVDAEGWELATDDAIWPTFSDESLMKLDLSTVSGRPRHLGVDLRSFSAVVSAIEDGERMIIVEELMRERWSAEKVVAEIVRLGWRLEAGSTITLDPTLSEDELAHFRKAFQFAKIVSHKGSTERDGLRVVDRAICDATGKRRLMVWAGLETDPTRRGTVAALRGYDGLKHSKLAHAADAIRYLCLTKLPIRSRVGASDLAQGGLEREPVFR